MSEFRTITADTYKKDDVLVNRTDSTRTARVVEAIKRDNKFTGFLVVFNNGKQGKLSKFDLEKDSCPWVLRGTSLESGDTLAHANGDQATGEAVEAPFVQAEVIASGATSEVIMTEGEAHDFPITDTTPEWNEVEQLRKELEAANALVVLRDSKITELRAALDNLIDAQSPSADHSAAQDDRNAELQEQVNELRTDLEKAYQLVAERNVTNKELTEQLDEARAELALSKVPAELKPVAASVDLSAVPHKEFSIIRDIKEADMCRMERDGWEIQHIQFMSDEYHAGSLNIAYYRIVTPAPITPEPHKAVEAIPGTHIVIQPVEAAPVERFNANEYMEEALTQSMNAANQAVIDRLPIYQKITNRPLGLPPMKPTARVS